jgi:DHA3 family macrolide efflux protein-like MFS transporter
VPQPKNNREHEPISPRLVLKDVVEGIKYTYAWKGMFLLMLGASLINMLATPAFTLLPLYVTQHFMKGATELAWLESAMGIGVIVGGLVLGVWGGFKRKVLTIMVGILGMGIGITALGLLGQEMYPFAIAIMGVLGVMNATANGPIGAIFQTKIPAEMQGRIFMVLNSLSSAASPLGLLLAGPLADKIGLQVYYISAGLMCLCMGVFGILEKRVYTLDDQLPGGQLIESAAEPITH